jgi:drug/metabolite transporter (DMT)-like permease
VRALIMVPMSLLFFWGLARVPMAQAIALTFIAPLLSLFLASALIGETIGRRTALGSSIAFCGAVLFADPSAERDDTECERGGGKLQWRQDVGSVLEIAGAAELPELRSSFGGRRFD